MNRKIPALLLLSAAFPLAAAPAGASQTATANVRVAQSEEPRTPPAASVDAPPARSDDGLLDRARRAVEDAGREVGDAATAAGRSAADYLSDNPDLNRQVLDFGRQLGVPGFEGNADGGAQLTVTRLGDGQLQVSAYGLPAEREVRLGWLEDERFRALETLSADENGRIDATIDTPPSLAPDQAAILALETPDRRLRLASDPIQPL